MWTLIHTTKTQRSKAEVKRGKNRGHVVTDGSVTRNTPSTITDKRSLPKSTNHTSNELSVLSCNDNFKRQFGFGA